MRFPKRKNQPTMTEAEATHMENMNLAEDLYDRAADLKREVLHLLARNPRADVSSHDRRINALERMASDLRTYG